MGYMMLSDGLPSKARENLDLLSYMVGYVRLYDGLPSQTRKNLDLLSFNKETISPIFRSHLENLLAAKGIQVHGLLASVCQQ